MNANLFTYAQWERIIWVAKSMDMGVEYTARRYGLLARKNGKGIWGVDPSEEVIPATDMEDWK